MHIAMTRRSFLSKSSLVIAGAVLSSRIDIFNATPAQAAGHPPFKPHAFLEIGADETIAAKIKSNISERAAATIEEETSLISAPKKADIEEAREEVVNVLRDMNEKGELNFVEE